MKDSVYSNEDIINNVLGSKKILKNEINFKDSENKENISLIMKGYYTESEMYDFCNKLGFTYFTKYYPKFFHDENVVFVNEKKHTILKFEKNKDNYYDGYYTLETIITFENGEEQVNLRPWGSNFELIMSNFMSIKENNLNLLETPISTLEVLYNNQEFSTYFTLCSKNIINEKLLQDIKKVSKNTSLEKEILQTIKNNYEKDKEDSKDFDKKYSEIDIFSKKYHRYKTSKSMDYSYSTESLSVKSIGQTYVQLQTDKDDIFSSNIYVSKVDFDSFFKDNNLLFEEYKNIIMNLFKNITNDKLIDSILEDKLYIKDTSTDYTELYATNDDVFGTDYHIVSKNFNIRLNEGTSPRYTDMSINFEFNELHNPCKQKDFKTKIEGTPFDILLAYAETKDKEQYVDNIKYYENIQLKLNNLNNIITKFSDITSEKFTMKDYELENTFKKCIENICKVQDVIADKINFMCQQTQEDNIEDDDLDLNL